METNADQDRYQNFAEHDAPKGPFSLRFYRDPIIITGVISLFLVMSICADSLAVVFAVMEKSVLHQMKDGTFENLEQQMEAARAFPQLLWSKIEK